MRRNTRRTKTKMSTRHKPSTRGSHLSTRKSKVRDLDNRKGKFKRFVLFVVAIAALTIYLYQFAPDVITFKVMLSDGQEERIREIVRDEMQNQQKQNEIKSIIEEAKASETPAEETKTEEPTKVETQPVTSRGGVTSRSSSSIKNTLTGYRVTSYHPGDDCASTNKTGSGKSTNDFNTTTVEGKRVYTYKGRVVVAAWTNELYKSGYNVKGAQSCTDYKFHYGQEITLTINGTDYPAIVLDSCGAAGWNDRGPIIDIFVPNGSNTVNANNVTVKL